MDGDMGVATGEQGTILRYVKKSKLAGLVLTPLEKVLNRVNYCGYIDVNCIVGEDGIPWPLEFTMRPGWPTFNIQQELHKDTANWLLALTSGQEPNAFVDDTIAIGVVLSVPDYPYSHLTRKEVIGTPIYGIKPATWKHLHACEMMMGEAPCRTAEGIETRRIPVTAGDYVLVMSATGETVWDAKQTCYSRLKRLRVPNSPMWRTDIGDRLSQQLPKLQEMGFALNLPFSSASPT
jgi:phosphoribosylamine---glycine ligase